MRVHIIKHDQTDNFGYIANHQPVPPEFRIWATINSRDWTVAYTNGRKQTYGSFREIHQDLYDIMARDPEQERSVRNGHESQGVWDEPITDFREQWAEIGAQVENGIREQDDATNRRRNVQP